MYDEILTLNPYSAAFGGAYLWQIMCVLELRATCLTWPQPASLCGKVP